MKIDIELLLARHPLLFLGWECRVKGFDSGDVLGGNVYERDMMEIIEDDAP